MSGIINTIENLTISGTGGGGGGSVSPSSFGGKKLGELTTSGTGILPATTQDYNYYTVSRSAVLPITVDGLTLSNKRDFVLFQDGQWIVQSVIPNTQSTQVENIANESLSGTATTQQEANIEFTNEIKDLKTRSFRNIGYCGTTQPLQAREDDIFYQTNATSSYGSDLPTNFPIQVYKWNNGAWSTNTEDWTPDVNDVIINININPPIAFVWQNGWSPTTQGLSKTDNISIDRNNNGELQVKIGGVRFDNINSGSIANGLENNNKKLVKADDLYDKAIVESNLQLETTSLGDTNLVLNLNNSDGAPVASQKLLKQGNDYTTLTDNDVLASLNITTQELRNIALSAVKKYIQDSLSGAISPVLTNNLTANRAVITNNNGKLAASSVALTANTTNGVKTFTVNEQGLVSGYTAKTLGRGLNDSSNVIGHSNAAVTAKTNTNIAGVSYDSYGHITGKGTEYSVQTSMSSSPTDSQFLTAKAVYDNCAPIGSVYAFGDMSSFVDPNNAIFNFNKTGTELRQRGQRDFFVKFIDPISDTTFYGSCRTKITVNNHTNRDSNTVIEQTAKQINPSSFGSKIVFKRIGIITGVVNATKITSATISWNRWIPIDYPQTYLSSLLNKTDFNDGGYIGLTITGGVALFDLDFISPKSTLVKDIIVTAEFRKYSQFFKLSVRATLGNKDNPLNGGVLMVGATAGSSLKCSRVGTANNNYSGQLVATLGGY